MGSGYESEALENGCGFYSLVVDQEMDSLLLEKMDSLLLEMKSCVLERQGEETDFDPKMGFDPVMRHYPFSHVEKLFSHKASALTCPHHPCCDFAFVQGCGSY